MHSPPPEEPPEPDLTPWKAPLESVVPGSSWGHERSPFQSHGSRPKRNPKSGCGVPAAHVHASLPQDGHVAPGGFASATRPEAENCDVDMALSTRVPPHTPPGWLVLCPAAQFGV